MVRTLVGASLALILTFSLVNADEIKGTIKIVGQRITITSKDAGTKTYPADKELKVYKLEKKKRVELPDGLKSAEVKDGVSATIITYENKVTEITIDGKKKKN
jgi:hypothetical protein